MNYLLLSVNLVLVGDRALSVAGPRAWNALPADIRWLETFKKNPKAHSFSVAYDT